MLIDDLLVKTPPQFTPGESGEDRFELVPHPELGFRKSLLFDPLDPRDRITVCKYGSLEAGYRANLAAYRKEVLNIAGRGQGVGIQESDEGPDRYVIALYKADDEAAGRSTYYYAKSGLAPDYSYVAVVAIHRKFNPRKSAPSMDMLIWSSFLNENVQHLAYRDE